MAESGDGQSRLDRIVRLIAGVMVAEVCSIYLRRQDGSLELFATEGLKTEAVHRTRLKRAEGLVGRCAELSAPINASDAQSHPAFSFRPETGEEEYHSMLAVPIQRSGKVLGVLVVQNHTKKEYSDEDVEVLQSTAMVVAELLVSGAVEGAEADLEITKSLAVAVTGEPMSEGIALGHAVLHQSRGTISALMSEDPTAELKRLDHAISGLRDWIDDALEHESLAIEGEHRDVLDAYRMFAHDSGWERRLREAVEGGLTAEAAVDQVQNATRARMLRQKDQYWRERMHDLDDLSDRLLRILNGASVANDFGQELPSDTILLARTMGPVELLDYDHTKLRGLIVEDGSGQSHVAIVAKALGIAAVGQAHRIVEKVSTGDAVIVDAETGEVHLRPPPDVISAFADKVRFRARRQEHYKAQRDQPAITKDGVTIPLQINAGLLMDMPHLAESGADGVGLFRTELLFMLSRNFPRLQRQIEAYKTVLNQADGKPVVFRALDIGGDKMPAYIQEVPEENPAMGWRGVRLYLDRSALVRTQLRAMLRACAGTTLRLMIPMVSTAVEIDAVRAVLERELEIAKSHGHTMPSSIELGAMFEVPGLLFELDALLPRVDFLSIGSNDLLQFMFAADRTNAHVSTRFDSLSLAPLRALRSISAAADKSKVPLTVCGEMAGRPLEAMALIGLGVRSLSMSAASVGPVKAMVLSLDAAKVAARLNNLLDNGTENIRDALREFARVESIEL